MAWVQFLVRELRSRRLHGVAKIEKPKHPNFINLHSPHCRNKNCSLSPLISVDQEIRDGRSSSDSVSLLRFWSDDVSQGCSPLKAWPGLEDLLPRRLSHKAVGGRPQCIMCGSLHRAAHNTAAGFPQIQEKEKESRKL